MKHPRTVLVQTPILPVETHVLPNISLLLVYPIQVILAPQVHHLIVHSCLYLEQVGHLSRPTPVSPVPTRVLIR